MKHDLWRGENSMESCPELLENVRVWKCYAKPNS
jgi:hypothetical protein